MNIFITGFGCVSPLGLNASENQKSLQSGKDGLDKSVYLQSRYALLKNFGEVKADTETLRNAMQLQHIPGLTRTDILAFKAFREAIENAQLTPGETSSRETAFLSASTVGGMCLTDELYRDANLLTADSEFVHSYNCAAHTLQIARFYGMKGFTNTINTACSSSANAIMMGMRLIRSGRIRRAIVGGAESLAKYTVNGFNSLQLLSDSKCKPFDKNLDGLNLGEAAAYIVLEAEEICKHKQHYGRVIGAGNSNDAFHASSLSENAIGVIKCMELALQDANILPVEVSYINAHGTGTPNNDQVELTGFGNIFSSIPPFSSTKSYTGHTLGASGALEAIFSILSLNHNELYPNLRTTDPIQDCFNSLVKQYTPDVDLK
ncbi:MAG: beta-ketoacyl-[acyl-carrier-protein] synthase family protein, partial [Bacteroidia bacterium]|nr:beta-ketoacyl-[acyl-carrier-protein] synthase family protein [Bacteroidia bacterium]